jgi:hypothetical protein
MSKQSFLLLLPFFSISFLACASPTSEVDDDVEPVESQDEAFTVGARSGWNECPGLGWKSGAQDWNKVKGTYMRAGSTATLSIFEDPNAINEGAPNYLRTVNNVPESGRIGLGVDNPAIGPVIAFFPNGNFRNAKDHHWVLAQQRSITGKIVGMCLANAESASDTTLKPVYYKRLGL